MRTLWNGSISFGLVNIPVGLAVATQRGDIAYRMLHRECGTPLQAGRFCPFHEREIDSDDTVRGWEFARGQFVLVEESDLETIALSPSEHIHVLRFVPARQVEPLWFDRTYYLDPGEARAQRRPYALLLQAMRKTKTIDDRQVRPLGPREPLCDQTARGRAGSVDAVLCGGRSSECRD